MDSRSRFVERQDVLTRDQQELYNNILELLENEGLDFDE